MVARRNEMVARRGTEEENGHAEGGKEIARWERWCVMSGRWHGWTAARIGGEDVIMGRTTRKGIIADSMLRRVHTLTILL